MQALCIQNFPTSLVKVEMEPLEDNVKLLQTVFFSFPWYVFNHFNE